MIEAAIQGAITTAIAVGASGLSYYLGLRKGRTQGAEEYARLRSEVSRRTKALEGMDGRPLPVVRRAVVKPTSRDRSQVDLED